MRVYFLFAEKKNCRLRGGIFLYKNKIYTGNDFVDIV